MPKSAKARPQESEDSWRGWKFSTKYPCYEFGRALVETNDLDPTYVALYHAGLEPKHLRAWLMGFWCFNHPVTASWVAEVPSQFWKRLKEAAGDKEMPRGNYRRHYRGQQAARSVDYLESRGLDSLFADITDAGGTAELVTDAIRGWVGFGPTVAFKAADMSERLGICPIDFGTAYHLLPDTPRKGAELLARMEGNFDAMAGDTPRWAVGRVLQELGRMDAPPGYERKLGFQEAETVLCKWKQNRTGGYDIGIAVTSLQYELESALEEKVLRGPATRLLDGGARGGLW